MADSLQKHERSLHHIHSFEQWKELEKRIMTDSTIDRVNQGIYQQRVKNYKIMLFSLSLLLRYLCTIFFTDFILAQRFEKDFLRRSIFGHPESSISGIVRAHQYSSKWEFSQDH